ncbi:DUF3943 domain-containing protein [Jiulongibacter sediminis]|uniref:DUF3943 domain-containing protein n=1 Tax=Jiulongibacter sediminis TaxID=1605367 RepID=UPI0006DBE84B|nr:DUF3943 domain-containing protein [Jiulongibacter sediminis]
MMRFILLLLFSTHLMAQGDSIGVNQRTSGLFRVTTQDQELKHYFDSKAKQQLRAFRNGFFYGLTCEVYLMALPEEISKWDRDNMFSLPHLVDHYRETFSNPPVIDHDVWYVNYLGHPYQGAFYYNSIRSQGGTVLASSVNAFLQTIIWEYLWEGGRERPSIQDLTVTPLSGIVLGELSHKASMAMARNGYSFPEKVLVTLIDPSFLLNGNFKTARHLRPNL